MPLKIPTVLLGDLHYDSADALGVRPSQEFMPHVSLMRPETVQQLPEMFHAFVEHDGTTAGFDRLALLRRDQSRGGSVYRAVREWQLG